MIHNSEMFNDQLIIFDLDDTLIDTSDVYWKARAKFVEKLLRELINEEGINKETIIKQFEKIETFNMNKFGFAPNRYEQSMLDTCIFFSKSLNHRFSDETILDIKSCGSLILDHFPQPISGAQKVLKWAANYYRLAVMTRGDDSFQRLKLKKAGMYDYFDFIHIVPKKDVNILSNFIQYTGYHPQKTWIVGDSIKSDINPGIQVGANCVFYAYKHPHYYWIQDNDSYTLGSFYKISKLDELKEILKFPSSFNMVTKV